MSNGLLKGFEQQFKPFDTNKKGEAISFAFLIIGTIS